MRRVSQVPGRYLSDDTRDLVVTGKPELAGRWVLDRTPPTDSGQPCTVQLHWGSGTLGDDPWTCLFAQDFGDRLVLRIIVGDPDGLDFYDLVKTGARLRGSSR